MTRIERNVPGFNGNNPRDQFVRADLEEELLRRAAHVYDRPVRRPVQTRTRPASQR